MNNVDTKHCPICTKDLPIDEFGICRSRRDGRNLYCKRCICEKVTAQRRGLKEYKQIRKQYQAQGIEYYDENFSAKPQIKPLSKLAPVERVREAIRNGARTQRDIGWHTKLGKDEIGDAIANLLLWTKEIRTRVIDGTRMYFINEVPERPQIEILPVPFFDLVRKAGAPVVKGEKRIQKVA